jgi:hypothetical protein
MCRGYPDPQISHNDLLNTVKQILSDLGEFAFSSIFRFDAALTSALLCLRLRSGSFVV